MREQKADVLSAFCICKIQTRRYCIRSSIVFYALKIEHLKKRPVIAFSVFFASFGLYLTTICPNMYWRDSPEFQVVAYQLGIAHPAGSPFYALLAKIYTFLPLGSIAFKVNLVSAFFGALLISLIFLLLTECLVMIFPSGNKSLLILSGLIAASFYAFSRSLWHNSIIAEVYTLQNCFIVLIAFFLIRGLRRDEKPSLYLAAFLFGLSTGAHIIMILYIPALLVFLWLFFRKRLSLSHLGTLIMFVILGASIYLYLPIRSSVDPYYDWGNPENVKNFITHVTDRKDTKRHFFFSPEKFIRNFKEYGKYYFEDFNVLGIILGLTGVVIFFRKKPRLFLGLGMLFFSQWPFFIRYWPWSSAFIATFLFFTLGIGVGIFGIIWKVQSVISRNPSIAYRYRFLPGVLLSLCVIQIFFLCFSNWKVISRTDYWEPYNFHHYLYDQIEFRGVLVSTLYYFGIGYLQQCESYRLDMTNLFLSEILGPHVFNTVTPERYPLIRIPSVKGPKLGEAIINANIKNHPFYWDPSSKNTPVVKKNIQPNGFLYRITPSPRSISLETKKNHIKELEDFFSNNPSVSLHYNDPEENDLYSYILQSYSLFFCDRDEYSLVITHLKAANRLTPEDVSVLNGLGSAYAGLRSFDKAETYFKKAQKINPSDIMTLQNLGQLYLDTEKYSQALACYQKILKKDSNNSKAYFGMGQYYEKIGDLHKARDAFRKVITLNPENSLAAQARKRLSDISH